SEPFSSAAVSPTWLGGGSVGFSRGRPLRGLRLRVARSAGPAATPVVELSPQNGQSKAALRTGAEVVAERRGLIQVIRHHPMTKRFNWLRGLYDVIVDAPMVQQKACEHLASV